MAVEDIKKEKTFPWFYGWITRKIVVKEQRSILVRGRESARKIMVGHMEGGGIKIWQK